MLRRLVSNVLYSPADGTGITPELGKEDIIKFLGEDEKDEPIPLDDKDNKSKDKVEKTDDDEKETKDDDKDNEEKDNDEKELDELKELEDELDEDDAEPDDEKLELVTPVRRKEILKAYPDLFEKFPYLEKAYYRDQQFTELFPTPKDAREAVDKAQTLDKFEQDLIAGNTEKMLLAVKSEDSNAFNKVVDNYLTTLQKVDEKAYLHVIGNTIKHTIMEMVQEARASGNEALQNAAAILNQFAFGSSKFTPPWHLSVPEDTKDDSKERALAEREAKFYKQQFDTANTDLRARVDNSIRATIDAHIDPKQSMTDYVRKNASREASEQIKSLIKKDTTFNRIVDRLWDKAKENNYSRESTDKIRSAYLSKARTLLPTVIKKARNEALKGMGKRVVEDKEDKVERPNRRNTEQPRSNDNDKGKIKPGMSSLEFLMSED